MRDSDTRLLEEAYGKVVDNPIHSSYNSTQGLWVSHRGNYDGAPDANPPQRLIGQGYTKEYSIKDLYEKEDESDGSGIDYRDETTAEDAEDFLDSKGIPLTSHSYENIIRLAVKHGFKPRNNVKEEFDEAYNHIGRSLGPIGSLRAMRYKPSLNPPEEFDGPECPECDGPMHDALNNGSDKYKWDWRCDDENCSGEISGDRLP